MASAVRSMSEFALQIARPDPSRARLAALDLEVALRELELSALRRDLQALQTRYLRELGTLQAQLIRLEQAVADEEVRAGLRPPPDPADDEPADEADRASGLDGPVCAPGSAPSDDLKRLFREIARTVHPDRATDDATRFRRHSIMAEANRAYAERDEDRLRLIMRAWRWAPEAIGDHGDDPERIRRRLAENLQRLATIEIELSDLRTSAIGELKRKLDKTSAQGWDLFAEMVTQVKHEIARHTARLITLQKTR